jgi:hypothetical protein
MKKNRLLMLALGALAVGALVSCGGGTDDGGGGDGGNTDVPTQEGSYTFTFKMSDDSAAQESYASVYLTGNFNNFATGYDAVEMQQLEGDTSVWYAFVDASLVEADTTYGYQLVIGYNESANMADASSGLQWDDTRKTDEALALAGGTDNLIYTLTEGSYVIDLGTHKFSHTLPAPADPLKNYTLKFTFTKSVPTWGQPLIFGSINGWVTPSSDKTDKENEEIINAAKLTTADPDRKVRTITYDEIYANSYQYKLLVEYTTATTSITWNAVDETQENKTLLIYQTDGDNYTLDLGTVTMDFATKLPDPESVVDIDFVLVNSGTGELGEGVVPAICGDFTSWAYTEMTKQEDGSYILADYTVSIASHQLGIVNFAEGGTSWVGKIAAEEGNLQFTATATMTTVTISGDFSKLGIEASVGTVAVTDPGVAA